MGKQIKLAWHSIARGRLDIQTQPGEQLMETQIKALEDAVAHLKEEMDKFGRGNQSAGTRARKHLQDIKRVSQEIRVQIQDTKKANEK